jgi:diguanylate cyclase (GGDEF)-like protein/PAS domain S-box-containing protein
MGFSTASTEKLLAGEIEIHRETGMLRKDGSTSWIRLTARMLLDEAGKPQYGIAIFEDINEKKQAEAALRESEERFRATFENAPLGITNATFDGMFISANPKLLEILDYTLEEFTRLSILDITHPADRELTLSNFQMLVSGQTSSYVSEKRHIRKDGSFVWMNVTTALMRVDGVPKYVVGILEDVTARRSAEEDLRRALEHSYHLANHDALTGLANRASFNDRLQDALSYAKRDGHLVAVHLLDLDRFKAINDTLGHHIGDCLLKDVANRIKAQTRATDVVARLGGDEFVIIQTHLTTSSAAGILAEKIVEELGRTVVLEGQEVHSGTSIGIALFPDDAEDAKHLVKIADLALYEAKSRGRYNFQFYRHEMGTAVEEAQGLEQDLRRALHEGQFRLHYQPQFDLQNGRISGIEVLIRWQHPEKGLLPAAEFIRDAENTSLTPPIGEWTLYTACRQHKKWMDAGLAVPLILNISLRQLRHPRFLQTLRRILKETELPPLMVQLETCESALWDPNLSTSLLTDLKNIGVRLALDNFGTELTALSSLHRFPLDVVKPSRGLVKELPCREQEAAVLSAVVSIAHKMKIAVCAEGVETADELTAVREHGCDAAQGFLLRSPVSESEMDRLIEAELAHY